jgi:hypothetical protein
MMSCSARHLPMPRGVVAKMVTITRLAARFHRVRDYADEHV